MNYLEQLLLINDLKVNLDDEHLEELEVKLEVEALPLLCLRRTSGCRS